MHEAYLQPCVLHACDWSILSRDLRFSSDAFGLGWRRQCAAARGFAIRVCACVWYRQCPWPEACSLTRKASCQFKVAQTSRSGLEVNREIHIKYPFMGGGLSRISSGKSRGLRRSSSHQEVNSLEVLKTRSASKRADNQTRSWGSISLLRRKQPAETRAEIAPTKTHAETDLAADRQMADDQHMAEGDASPASRRSGEGGDQQLWTQRQQALRQADTLQNKSLDSVGLAALIQQHDSEAAGVGAGGKPRPPSIDVLCAGDTAYSSSSAATPFHRCASLSNAPTERPPFALFEGRQVQETWAVMTADLKEVCVYIYMYIYTCMHKYIYMNMYIYIYIYVHMPC